MNYVSRKIITNNDSVLFEISGMDCDNITINFIPQILTEKKGGLLDIRKCFLFLRFRGFSVRYVRTVFLSETLGNYEINKRR